jgi:hypothetical protein
VTNQQVLEKLPDGMYKVETAKKRSSPQNRWFHGICVPLVLEGLRNAGFNEVHDVHDAKMVIKALFLKRQVVNPNDGLVIEVIRDTSDLTTEEFTILMDEVVAWASEYLKIYVPLPGEQVQFKF